MEESLQKYLTKHNISFVEYSHPAVFTVEESDKVTQHIPGVRTKNLFLIDEKDNFYIVSLPGKKRLDIKNLQKHLKAKYLKFGSPEQLKEELHIMPGSVSLFAMVHAKNTRLIIDEYIWNAEEIGCHPNINTSMLVINRKELQKFCASLPSAPIILQL